MVKRFKKKPVVIEAMQIKNTQETLEHLTNFCKPRVLTYLDTNTTLRAFIDTLEGVHEASEGDWVIKGVRGECYPCREDIFNETYEEVSG